jgi:oligoendopeptidase F
MVFLSIGHEVGIPRTASAPRIDAGSAAMGDLPEWNLSDLYPGMDAPDLRLDLARAHSDAVSFEDAWKGRIADAAKAPGDGRLGAMMHAYEALEELIGRIVSYASLVYAGDTSDPKRAKLYGDIQEKMTDASAHLLFFALELNQVEETDIETALAADVAFARYRPWVEDLRKDKPFQLEDRVEQVFHEKSVTGRGAWNRLFDETMSSLRFSVDGNDLSLEPTLNLLQDPDPARRQAAAEALAKTF